MLLTEEDIDEILDNSHSDLSPEDELATAFDPISFRSDNENFVSEPQW